MLSTKSTKGATFAHDNVIELMLHREEELSNIVHHSRHCQVAAAGALAWYFDIACFVLPKSTDFFHGRKGDRARREMLETWTERAKRTIMRRGQSTLRTLRKQKVSGTIV